MIYIVIPAYNEEQKIGQTVKNTSHDLGKREHQLVVIDDGSKDGTISILKKLNRSFPLKILRHQYNMGPGAAFRTGMNWVLSKSVEKDVLVAMESGGLSERNLTLKMIKLVEQEKADIVVAGCYAPGGKMRNVPFERRILSRLANTLSRIAFSVPGVYTCGSFFRAYRMGVLMRAKNKLHGEIITDDGFFSTIEILIKLAKLKGIKILELPMILDWGKEKRISRMKIGKTIKSYLKYILKYKLEGY